MASVRTPHFILASTSPRRREFLAILDIPFTVLTPGSGGSGGVDETPLPGESPAELVYRLSRLKAQSVVTRLANLPPDRLPAPLESSIVIAADTDVALDGQILGKPANKTEAVTMLKRLRAGPHDVYSGLTIALPPTTAFPTAHLPPESRSRAGFLLSRLHHSQVWMRPYSDAEIEAYVSSGAPLDKAGAYGIQDDPFSPVGRLVGCFASVMGLPLGELAGALGEIDLSLPEVGRRCQRHTGVPCCQYQPE